MSEPNTPPASGIRGIASHSRRGRWLELELEDGRLIAFDTIDVVGCEATPAARVLTLTAGDHDEGESILIHLRGRESEHLTDVDGRALWALITEAR